MRAERDYLVKVVFPSLRERLERYRVHVDDIDLRWGITEGQAESDQILELCLREIEHCKPFFLGILGERYGWTPDQLPGEAVQFCGWAQHSPGLSMTELEIMHAVFSVPRQCSRAVFCFRDPQALVDIPEPLRSEDYLESDSGRRARLTNLKEQIRNSGQPLVESYPARWDEAKGVLVGLETFGERVLSCLWDAIRAELGLGADAPASQESLPNFAEELELPPASSSPASACMSDATRCCNS